jgi:hypothetical protein
MMKKMTMIVPLLAIVFAIGCGDPKVTGKVTFPDGTPLTRGQVMFQKEGFVASGDIQRDGSYSAGKNKDGDGIPPGTYEVFIVGASTFGELQNADVTPQVGPGGADSRAIEMAQTISLIHSKYTSSATSGLTVVVEKSMKYDIKVEPPL